MNVAVYLPFLAALAVAAAGPPLARRSAPAVGAVALSVLALVAAAGGAWSAGLLAATLIDDVRPGRIEGPVPDAVAVAATLALAVMAVRVGHAAARRARLRHRLADALDLIPGAAGPLLVVADDHPDAFAVPGRWRRPGRIVVTEGMLRALDPAQRRALYAHERAHLDDRHHLLAAAADLAAALNPVLRGVRTTVVFLCERWADERAAAEVGDRAAVAGAVAAAALARVDCPPRPALAFDGGGVPDRVNALRRPVRAGVRAPRLAAAAVAIMIIVADAHATQEMIGIWRLVTGR